jgi:hypothetical protein
MRPARSIPSKIVGDVSLEIRDTPSPQTRCTYSVIRTKCRDALQETFKKAVEAQSGRTGSVESARTSVIGSGPFHSP